MDRAFTRGAARRPTPKFELPILQWATGLTTSSRSIYAGWLIERGKDETVDSTMQELQVSTVTIRHGNGKLVTHWSLPSANLVVMADGVQTLADIRNDPDRFGCVLGWRDKEDGKAQSFFKAQVLLVPFIDAGVFYPVMMSMKSTITEDITKALVRQYDVLDSAKAKTGQEYPFYAFSIEIGPGAEVKRGSGQTKEIVPPIALVPEAIQSPYLREHYVGRNAILMEFIELRIDSIVEWSIRSSRAVAEVSDEGEFDT